MAVTPKRNNKNFRSRQQYDDGRKEDSTTSVTGQMTKTTTKSPYDSTILSSTSSSSSSSGSTITMTTKRRQRPGSLMTRSTDSTTTTTTTASSSCSTSSTGGGFDTTNNKNVSTSNVSEQQQQQQEAPTPTNQLLWEAHVLFWVCALGIKWICPTVLKWIAYDHRTISTLLVSVWIPFVYTISSIHTYTHTRQEDEDTKAESEDSRRRRRIFWLRYWSMGYAVIQVGRQIVQTMTGSFLMYHYHTIGSGGGHYQYNNTIQVLGSELQLFLYLYILTVNRRVLTTYCKYRSRLSSSTTDNSNKPNVNAIATMSYEPLMIVDSILRPYLLQLQAIISEPISKDVWDRYIHSKAQRVLDVLIMLQFMTEPWKGYILQLLDEGRTLLVLSVFLVLPSSLTNIGIIYVKYLLPSARYCSVTSNDDIMVSWMGMGELNDDGDNSGNAPGQIRRQVELLNLRYWVLNIMLSSCLAGASWFYWFVPFSTQIVFATWCYLTFPRTIREYYAVVETELVTFGFISGDSRVPLKRTKTVRVLKALAKRIPSANDAEGFRWADSEDEDSVGSCIDSDMDGESASVVSQRRRQRIAKTKVRRALGSRTKSSPSGLTDQNSSSSSSSPTRSHHVQNIEDHDEMNDDNIGEWVNEARTKVKNTNDEVPPPALLGVEGSDDSSVAAVCNGDMSSSSHDNNERVISIPVMNSGPQLWDQSSSSLRCEPFLLSSHSDGYHNDMIVDSNPRPTRTSNKSSDRFRETENETLRRSDNESVSSSLSLSSHLEMSQSFDSMSFDGGHMYDGSIRELRRSLRDASSPHHQQGIRRSERVRKMRQSNDEDQNLQILPGYLQPTESSRRGARRRQQAGRVEHFNDRDYLNSPSQSLLDESISASRQLRHSSRALREAAAPNAQQIIHIDDLDTTGINYTSSYSTQDRPFEFAGESSTMIKSPRQVRQRRHRSSRHY